MSEAGQKEPGGEEIRQIRVRMTEIPQAQWTKEDRTTFIHFLESVFKEDDPHTWGLRDDEVNTLEKLAKFDTDEPKTWPDRAKAARYEQLWKIINEPTSDPEVSRRFIEPMCYFEEHGIENEEYKTLEKGLMEYLAATEIEVNVIYDEIDNIKKIDIEEIGMLHKWRLEYRFEQDLDLGQVFNDPRNTDLDSLLAMLGDAERIPAESWNTELKERMTDFCDGYENRLGSFLLGENIENHIGINTRGNLDADDWRSWMDFPEAAHFGYEAFRLEKAILMARDEVEEAKLRDDLEKLQEKMSPLLDTMRSSIDAICVFEDERMTALKEKLQSLGREKEFMPEMGQRVIFQLHVNSAAKLIGNVLEMDERTVTLQCGGKNIPVIRERGTFCEVPPLAHEETKEYALEQAQKHIGGSGQVFFAQSEGNYKGPIVETTPSFAIQKVGDAAVLHRLKDLGRGLEIPQGAEVLIRKGGGTTLLTRHDIKTEQKAYER